MAAFLVKQNRYIDDELAKELEKFCSSINPEMLAIHLQAKSLKETQMVLFICVSYAPFFVSIFKDIEATFGERIYREGIAFVLSDMLIEKHPEWDEKDYLLRSDTVVNELKELSTQVRH